MIIQEKTVIEISSQTYDDALPFYKGLAAVQVKGKWGFIDLNGKIVIEPQFDEVLGFFKNLIIVKSNKKYSLVNVISPKLIPSKFDEINREVIYYSEYFFKAQLEDNNNILTADNLRINKYNQWILVSIDRKWGLVDSMGKIVVKLNLIEFYPSLKKRQFDEIKKRQEVEQIKLLAPNQERVYKVNRCKQSIQPSG